MRPVKGSASPSPTITLTSGVKLWNSPIPYLFGGLALMLALISVALVILLCSNRKRASSSSPSSSSEDFKLQVMAKSLEMGQSEPKILVIMAGDEKPTYVANPIVPVTYCTCQPETSPSSSTSPNHQSTH